MEVQVHIVNAFVDHDKGGNPAGVVLEAQRFTQEQKLTIAKQVGLSETAFVSPSQSADFKLEFFTPSRQIPHCGHATIATFSYLRQLGKIAKEHTSKETIDGRREIHIKSDMAFMEQLAPKYIELDGATREAVLTSLRLSANDLLDGHAPVIVNTGNGFLLVPLKNEATVRQIVPEQKQVGAIGERFNVIGYYVFSPDTRIAGRNAGARMFGPHYGIDEEAATGMAAGPLACYLYDRMEIKKENLLIEQGHLMSPASPSVIEVKLAISDGRIQNLMAGGKARVSESRNIII